MKKVKKEILFRLLKAEAPSSAENEAAQIWIEEAQKFCAEVHDDILGNVRARLEYPDAPHNVTPPKVLLTAHMDEIGL